MRTLLAVLAILTSTASAASAAESVERFDVVIDVFTDSSLRITETVVYDMDGVQRHGWERIIPKDAPDGPHLVISDVAARRDGSPDGLSVAQSSGAATVRIGEPDVTITGTHTYALSYTVRNGVRYFDDRDEIYWNAVPQDLRLPVGEATVTVNLPDGATIVDAPYCYTGPMGSSESDCVTSVADGAVTIDTLRPFTSQDGMTVAVAIAPGVIGRVAPIEDSASSFPWALFLPIAVFAGIVLILIIVTVGHLMAGLPRKRRDGGDIVVQYDPPKQCSAPEAAYLAGRMNTGRIFTAGVVQLAVEGWLTMRFNHEKKWYGKATEILFIRAREGHPEDPTLHQVMDSLFIIGPERTLTELKRDAKLGAAPVLSIAAGIPLLLERRGWVSRARAFSLFSRTTDEGHAAKEHLAGLKIYLGAAEKERLEFHNAPEHSPQTFEKLLPYAIALGVDQPWVAAFGDLQYVPAWTSGDFSAVGMVALSESLGELSSGASSVMNAYSSGTGGGGGSSGGGGGGGGGGGW